MHRHGLYHPLYVDKSDDADDRAKSSSDEIRLVKLYPGRWDDEIYCDIEHVSFEEAWQTRYVALSYVWGRRDADVAIETSLGRVDVTRNLFEALRRLRFTSGCRYVWIDALCIDQNNVGERNHQVRRMSDIYSSAHRVIVWLGETDGPDPFRCLYNLSAELVVQRAISEQDCEEIMTLFSREWFHRKWVIQEVAVARFAFVWCGGYQCDWSLMDGIISHLYFGTDGNLCPRRILYPMHRGSFTTQGAIGLNHALLISLLRQQVGPWNALCSLLIATLTFSCSDPRDHVYAITSLVRTDDPSKNLSSVLEPDYSSTVEETILRAIRWSLQNEGYYLLRYVSNHTSHGMCNHYKKRALPSWAAIRGSRYNDNSAVESGKSSLIPLSHTFDSHLMRMTPLKQPDRPSFSQDGNLFVVEGRILDTVHALDFKFRTRIGDLVYCRSLYGNSEDEKNLDGGYVDRWGGVEIRDTKSCLAYEYGFSNAGGHPTARYPIEKFVQDIEYEHEEDTVYPEPRRGGGPNISRTNTATATTMDYESAVAGLKRWLGQKFLCLTAEREIALVPPGARPGDRIVSFRGSSSTFVVRTCGEGHWNFIGECHVPGSGVKLEPKSNDNDDNDGSGREGRNRIFVIC